jgi:hypothetical protein
LEFDILSSYPPVHGLACRLSVHLSNIGSWPRCILGGLVS